jgi:hypothetical protein
VIIKPKCDALKIFTHARGFEESLCILLESAIPSRGQEPDDQRIGTISHPAMVLSAFASELYLKCLLCIETGEPAQGHDLERLFLKLEPATRHEIDHLWDVDIRAPLKQKVLDHARAMPEGRNIKNDLRYALQLGADAFTEIRYHYETGTSHFLLNDLPKILRIVTLRKQPTWDGALPKPSRAVD